MTNEQWERVKEVFDAALGHRPDERAQFLDEVCGAEETMRREVEALLSSFDDAGSFMAKPAVGVRREAATIEKTSLTKGQCLGHYEIREQIGAGGMGEVYLAEDIKLGRRVAIKVLSPSLTDERAKRRFLREAQAAATLDHPNICTIHEVGDENGLSFIVMQYIEGETLATRIKYNPLELRQALNLARQVAAALAEAHSHGILHRDIKPHNIMLTSRGQPKVLDFGLAKTLRDNAIPESELATERTLLSEAGTIAGTVPYMSPEQVRRDELDRRSDIFSFGTLLYEMLTAQQPFAGESVDETLAAILTREPPPMRLSHGGQASAEVEQLARKCLQKERDRRYQTLEDLIRDLDRICSYLDEAALPASTRKWRTLIVPRAALSVAALALLSAFAYLMPWKAGGRQPVAVIKSLVVMPLKSLNQEKADDYLGLGIADTVITKASQMPELIVRPISAVRRYEKQDINPMEVARELQADSVLAGTIQRAGDRIRVSMNLLRAEDGTSLWAETFDRELIDTFALQDDISLNIFKALNLTVSAQQKKQLITPSTRNPEAFDYYLRGKYYVVRENPEDNQTAISMLERAVAVDPSFPAAYAELARAYNIKAFYFTSDVEARKLTERASVTVDKALSLDPNLAEAHFARGVILWTDANRFPHEQAIQEYRRALALNPALDDVHRELGLVYSHIGLFDKAWEEIDKAVAINPSNTLARFRFGVIKLYQTKYEEAFAVFNRIPREVTSSPWSLYAATALLHLEKKKEVENVIEEFLRSYPRDEGGAVTSVKAMLLAKDGKEREAEAAIKSAITIGKGYGHFHHTAYNIAVAYALMNKTKPALEWLKTAAEGGFPCYPLFEKDAYLNSLRNDPQFVELMTKLKEEWQRYRATL
jgi:serine/threonine protein kinase/Tfp pilus assembly protein PilF